MSVEVIIEDARWDEVGLSELAVRAWDAVRAHLSLPEGSEIAVLGCNDQRIAELNSDFRGKPTPTNVLSWPSEERGSTAPGTAPETPQTADAFGDIAIAYETTLREADSGGLSLEKHAIHLLVHGTLHLLGYDHVNDADGDLMESVEAAILADLGIADPYSSGEALPDIDGKE